MSSRRVDILDAAIELLGDHGVRGVTHRAVDAAAGIPAGSTSNYFRTKDALLMAVVERFATRERTNWEDLAASACPLNPAELAQALAAFARDSTGPQRTLTLARYAILVEAAQHPALQAKLAVTGARVNAGFAHWLRVVGSQNPERDTLIVANHITGLVLHELAYPVAAFDPAPQLTVLIEALVGAGQGRPPDVEASWKRPKSGVSSTPRRSA
jgi:DNA-binding transcriptional regulator YbjK